MLFYYIYIYLTAIVTFHIRNAHRSHKRETKAKSEEDRQKLLYINLYYIIAQGKNDWITWHSCCASEGQSAEEHHETHNNMTSTCESCAAQGWVHPIVDECDPSGTLGTGVWCTCTHAHRKIAVITDIYWPGL